MLWGCGARIAQIQIQDHVGLFLFLGGGILSRIFQSDIEARAPSKSRLQDMQFCLAVLRGG